MKKAYLVFALPYVAILLGTIFNQAAVHANGGHMPVLFPGYQCMAELLEKDPVHVCMVPSQHLKFLGDWLIGTKSVTSIGDQLLEFGSDIQWPSAVLAVAMLVRDTFKRVI